MGRMTQLTVVFKPYIQPIRRICRHHGEAVASRVQLGSVRHVTPSGSSSATSSEELGAVVRQGDCQHFACATANCLGTLLRWAARSLMASQQHCGNSGDRARWTIGRLCLVDHHSSQHYRALRVHLTTVPSIV